MKMVEKFKEMVRLSNRFESCKTKINVDGKKIEASVFLDYIPEENKWIVVLSSYVNDKWIVVEKKFSDYEEAKKHYEEIKNASKR